MRTYLLLCRIFASRIVPNADCLPPQRGAVTGDGWGVSGVSGPLAQLAHVRVRPSSMAGLRHVSGRVISFLSLCPFINCASEALASLVITP